MDAEVCSIAPSDWEIISINDVCHRVTSGSTPSRRCPGYYFAGNWPWVKTKELKDGWIDDTEEHITEEAIENSSVKILPENTVLLALYGATVGQLGLLRKPMTCNQASCAMIVDSMKADFRYLFYQLLYHRPQLKSAATGAAQQNLSGELVKSIRLPFPTLHEQRAIAHILGSLDDKIELNRRMNETLEAIARAMFKSWFVDFDPVRAKAEGREPADMDAETSALFPSEFDESLLGLTPKGWAVRNLSDLCRVEIGGDWGNDEQFPDSKEVICLRGIDLENLRKNGNADAPCRWVKRTSLEKRYIDHCDVLIAASGIGPLGRSLWICPNLKGVFSKPMVYSNFCKRLRAKSQAEAIYLDRILNEMHRNNKIWDYATGTSIPNLDIRSMLNQHTIILPPIKLLHIFSHIVSPIYASLYSSETYILENIRDELLPKLLSGEIRIQNVEKIIRGKL